MEIQPLYSMNAPNEPISLFEGEIHLRQDDRTYIIEKAIIEAMWPPTQHCVIKLPIDESTLTEGDALLDIPVRQVNGIHVEVFMAILEKGYRVIFKAKQIFNVNKSQGNCDAIVVHIPNFFDMELHLETSEWDIEIRPVANIKDMIKVMSLQSGFALTHVGIIKQSKGARFTFEQAGKVIRAVETCLSFMRGAWCGLFLPVGWLEGTISWYYWDLPMVMPWRCTPIYWCTTFDLAELNCAFDKFIKLPEYPALVNVISFYTGANGFEAPDMAVMMTQIALELLVSLYVSEGTYREDKDVKIRRLLREKRISPVIPDELKELKEYCKENIKDGRPIDGPSAIIYLRNYFMHPKRETVEKIVKVPIPVMKQASDLGLAYVELIILNILGYNGHYTDRFTKRSGRVQWSTSLDAIQPVVNGSPV